MARITYTYQYKNYPDCPKATRLSKFWCSPRHGGFIGMAVGIVIMLLGALVYNANGHHLGAVDVILMLLGFGFFLFGALLVPALFKLFRISDRVYEKETGKKIN
ncbi:MAG: hypothetical protein IKQ45_03665 [Clostridia bacterium]|nr:hypothetical protein [Clostridia bacterium]